MAHNQYGVKSCGCHLLNGVVCPHDKQSRPKSIEPNPYTVDGKIEALGKEVKELRAEMSVLSRDLKRLVARHTAM